MAKKKPIHILIYGDPGAGKSIFASTFPKVLYFDFDNGNEQYEEAFPENKYLRGDKLIDLLSKAIDQIKAGTFQYETIVIDSLTNLENQAISRFKGLSSVNWSSSLYSSSQKKLQYDDWGNISGSTVTLLNHMRELPINIVIITQIDTIKDNGLIKYAPNLIGKGQLESMHFADVVGYLYNTAGQKSKERYLALSANSNDNFFAKSRTLAGELEPIKNPNYEKIYSLLNQDVVNLDFSE